VKIISKFLWNRTVDLMETRINLFITLKMKVFKYFLILILQTPLTPKYN